MAHVLFLTPYYPPEVGAPQTRISETATRLARRGHEVTVLTTLPNYPTGVVPVEYRAANGGEKTIDGVRVLAGLELHQPKSRLPAPYPRATVFRRAGRTARRGRDPSQWQTRRHHCGIAATLRLVFRAATSRAAFARLTSSPLPTSGQSLRCSLGCCATACSSAWPSD